MWYSEPGTPIQHEREKYDIEGEGFVWSHATMDSLAAMEQIEAMFLSISESIWLPQWSFDFWSIPYLLGRGISLAHFKEFMRVAHQMLTLEIALLGDQQKNVMQQECINALVGIVKGWNLSLS